MTMGHKTDRPDFASCVERNLPLPSGRGAGEGDIAGQATPRPNPLPKGEGTGRFQLPYLGVIGSQAKRKVLVRELTEAGLDDKRANAFRCPIGLPLGTNQPGEIAVSIAAELIQYRDALAAKL